MRRFAIIGRGAVGSAIFNDLNSIIEGVELYHTQNIDELLNDQSDVCFEAIIYAAVPGVKWKANINPQDDFDQVKQAFNQIMQLKLKSKRMILISTIDTLVDFSGAYGKNRLWLENQVINEFGQACAVIQLPALVGSTVKKNIWFDLTHPYPNTLNQSMCDKLNEYAKRKCRTDQNFYELNENQHLIYHKSFKELDKNQLGLYNATHPYSQMLWLDISNLGEIVLNEDFIKLGHKTLIASYYKNEPALLKMYELFEIVKGETFKLDMDRIQYDQFLNHINYGHLANKAVYVNNIKF